MAFVVTEKDRRTGSPELKIARSRRRVRVEPGDGGDSRPPSSAWVTCRRPARFPCCETTTSRPFTSREASLDDVFVGSPAGSTDMTRLVPALRARADAGVRQKFLHAAVSGLIWLAVLLPMPVACAVAEPVW